MKNKKTILLAINVVLFGIIYFSFTDEDEKKDKFDGDLLDTLSTLNKIDIHTPDSNRTIEIIRDKEGWIITQPFKWQAIRLKVSNLRTQLAHLTYNKLYNIKELAKRGEILDDYGINVGGEKITIQNNSNTIIFSLGAQSRDERFIYAFIQSKQSEDGHIYKIDKSIKDFIAITADDWAIQRFINQPLYSIDKISVIFRTDQNQTNKTTLEKIEQNWLFSEPFEESADSEKVMLTLNNLLSPRLSNLKKANNEFKIDDWDAKLEISGYNQKNEIYFKTNHKNDNKTIVGIKKNEETVFELNNNFWEDINNWSSKLRNRNLFPVNDDIDFFRINKQGTSSSFERNEIGQWQLIEENSTNKLVTKVDSREFTNFVNKFKSIEVDKFLSNKPNQQEIRNYNLETPEYYIEYGVKNHEINKFAINKTNEENDFWTIMNKSKSFICIVNAEIEKLLSFHNLDFRVKEIFGRNDNFDEISFNIIDENKTIIFDLKNDINSFQNLLKVKADKFINDSYSEDGSWINGDWVPWKYQLNFMTSDSGKDDKTHIIRFSERKGANTWYAGCSKTQTVFNIPLTYIDEMERITSKVEK